METTTEIKKDCGCILYHFENSSKPDRFKKLCEEHKKEKKKIYYENNKEKIAQRGKEWREKNKEILSEKNKVYKEANKEKLTMRIECKCGGHFQVKHRTEHERTNKHLNYLKSCDV